MQLKFTAEALVGVAVLAFAGIVHYEATNIPVSPLYARVGPAVFPFAIAACMAAMGIALLIQGLRGGWSDDDPDLKLAVDFRALAWLAGGLALNVALIQDVGFTVASTAMFVAISRCFGSDRPLADAGVGFALSAAAYIGFAKVLGINIGAGFLENLVF